MAFFLFDWKILFFTLFIAAEVYIYVLINDAVFEV